MSDLIDRQAAIDAIDVLGQEHRYKIPGKLETYSQYHEAWQDALDRAEGAIDNLPTVHPEPPKMGKWIRYYIRPNVFKDLYWHCSECGHRETYSYADRYYKFCPRCGAYMGGE